MQTLRGIYFNQNPSLNPALVSKTVFLHKIIAKKI